MTLKIKDCMEYGAGPCLNEELIEALVVAADHLIKELSDWSLDCCREGLGNTNVSCIKHARDQLRDAITRTEQ